MLYLGLDVHSKWFTLNGFDKTTGECFYLKRVANEPGAIREAFAALPAPRRGALEAGTNALALHRVLAPYFEELLIVAPNKMWDRRGDPRAKTDRRDALALAEALAEGRLRGIYRPDAVLQVGRSLVRGRLQVTRDLTRLVSQLYALIRSYGFQVEKKALTKKGRAWLGEITLPEEAATILHYMLERLDLLQTQQRQLEAEITRWAAADPICRRLQTIPSVGPFTALVLRVEIGDIRRFKSADALINYTALVPRVFQSSDRIHYGALTKAGNALLRYVAVLFAENVIRSKQDTPFKRKYYRLGHTHDRNELKVMIARDFLAVVHSLWTHETDWQDPRPEVRRVTVSVA
ncbi:MAG: IS110 family RNA-guided transposase [Armatimonadota bacterium]